MKIAIIGPGIMPIPPTGWGAVEILIWDQKVALEKLGHEVKIVNTPHPMDILKGVNEFSPDFVHIQYDDFIEIYPYIQYPCAITSHFGYLEQPDKWDYYRDRIVVPFNRIKPNVCCLSSGIRDVYRDKIKIPEERLFVTPNGVDYNIFEYTDEPKHADSSIYLAKIDYRKRQFMFQGINSLYYAGNNADPRFDINKNYLGDWSKEDLHKNLTDYGNLVLLSDGEAHPLVCLEAFAAGLGVVVSEWAAANLDIRKSFITVIPEDKISDLQYVEDAIISNRSYSIAHRDEIREYGREFEWTNIIENHYLPVVEEIIGTSKL